MEKKYYILSLSFLSHESFQLKITTFLCENKVSGARGKEVAHRCEDWVLTVEQIREYVEDNWGQFLLRQRGSYKYGKGIIHLTRINSGCYIGIGIST